MFRSRGHRDRRPRITHSATAMALMAEPVLLLGWAPFNLLVLAVLVPFRRGEPWAWSSSWLLALGCVSLIAFDSEAGTSYVIAGASFAACLLLTRGAFTR